MKTYLLLSRVFLILLLGFSSHSLAVNRIFLLDTSGTMNEGGMFERVKYVLASNYVSRTKVGEHIIILTFDSLVVLAVDQQITDESNIREINEQILGFIADGQRTWMSRALQRTIEQVRRIIAQYPGEEVNVYFITDGKNDPPPDANEPPLLFVEVLIKYFRDIRGTDANMYVLLTPGDDDSTRISRRDIEDIEKETAIRIIPIASTSEPLIPPEVILGYFGFDFEDINPSISSVTKAGSLKVEEIIGEAEGAKVILRVEPDSSLKGFFAPIEIMPNSLDILYEGQLQNIELTIPEGHPTGVYKYSIMLNSDSIIVSPTKVIVNLSLSTATERSPGVKSWIGRIVVTILSLLALNVVSLFLRKRNLLIRREDSHSSSIMTIKNIKKVPLADVGLPNYQIGMGIWPQEVFSLILFRDHHREIKFKLGETIKCVDRSGNEVSLTFEKISDSSLENTLQPEFEHKEDPDFFMTKQDT